MLAHTKSTNAICGRISKLIHTPSIRRIMSEESVRSRFKRLAEVTREQRAGKQQKMHNEPDTSQLKLTVMGNGSVSSPPSVIVAAASGGYIFNCGEGVQKTCSEYKLKIPRVQNLFFTSSKWEHVGGLPGYCLTGQAMGLLGFFLHGPSNVMKLLDCTQSFLRVDYIHFEHHKEDIYKDQALQIHRCALKSSDPLEKEEIYAFVCRGTDKPGRLLLDKCVSLGVPVGPLFKQLKNGSEVTLENGNVVKPEDVMMPGKLGPVFIVLECPSENYIESLFPLRETAKFSHTIEAGEELKVTCIVHITPSHVYKMERYQEFLKLFPESTLHLNLSDANFAESSPAAFRSMTRLNLINGDVFPNLPRAKKSDVPSLTAVDIRSGCIIPPAPNTEISIEEYVEEAKKSENFDELSAELSAILKSNTCEETREYPRVTFLGTGSSVPTKDRNVSGILINPSEDSYILLDCGESTLAQIVRLHGVEKANDILRKLKFIYISHIHADHHLGLFGILKRLKKVDPERKITVLGPSFLPGWFKKFSENFELLECNFIDCADLLRENLLFGPQGEVQRLDFAKHSVKRVATCIVDHCPESYGIRIDLDNYSIVYSGDTRPCPALVELGKNCDLLLHEATMENDLAKDAHFKGHSTTTQAKAIGETMNAKFTLLTHFSQRYAKIPMLDDSMFADGKLGLAFDFMTVSPRNLRVLPHIYPMLKSLFATHFELLQERSYKKKLKEKILKSN